MAKTGNQHKSRKEKSKARERQAKRDLAILKEKGLYRGDLRKKTTRYARAQARKFSDVIEGKAAVVNAPSYKDAREYKGKFDTKFNKIIVPKKKGERVRYSNKSHAITSTRTEVGTKIKKMILPKTPERKSDLPKAPRGTRTVYAVPFGFGHNAYRRRWTDFNEMVKDMAPYENKSHNPYKQWQNYIEIEYVDAGLWEDNDEEEF